MKQLLQIMLLMKLEAVVSYSIFGGNTYGYTGSSICSTLNGCTARDAEYRDGSLVPLVGGGGEVVGGKECTVDKAYREGIVGKHPTIMEVKKDTFQYDFKKAKKKIEECSDDSVSDPVCAKLKKNKNLKTRLDELLEFQILYDKSVFENYQGALWRWNTNSIKKKKNSIDNIFTDYIGHKCNDDCMESLRAKCGEVYQLRHVRDWCFTILSWIDRESMDFYQNYLLAIVNELTNKGLPLQAYANSKIESESCAEGSVSEAICERLAATVGADYLKDENDLSHPKGCHQRSIDSDNGSGETILVYRYNEIIPEELPKDQKDETPPPCSKESPCWCEVPKKDRFSQLMLQGSPDETAVLIAAAASTVFLTKGYFDGLETLNVPMNPTVKQGWAAEGQRIGDISKLGYVAIHSLFLANYAGRLQVTLHKKEDDWGTPGTQLTIDEDKVVKAARNYEGLTGSVYASLAALFNQENNGGKEDDPNTPDINETKKPLGLRFRLEIGEPNSIGCVEQTTGMVFIRPGDWVPKGAKWKAIGPKKYRPGGIIAMDGKNDVSTLEITEGGLVMYPVAIGDTLREKKDSKCNSVDGNGPAKHHQGMSLEGLGGICNWVPTW